MAASRNYRSDEDWLELITQSRRSGLADADWCRQNRIPISSFYNAVSRLRKKAREILELLSGGTGKGVYLTSETSTPDVVPIRIEPEFSPAEVITPGDGSPATYLDNSHSIEILMGNTCIRICNGTDPALLSAILSSLRRLPC